MQPDRMITTLVEFTIQKGMRAICEEPQRGTRNLLEMGDMFSSEPLHHDLIDYVADRLRDDNSPYYEWMARMALRTDPAMAATFFTDLGYHALTHGAALIRDIEAQAGFRVPWCLTVETAGDPEATGHLASLIEQGNAMGIYCYVVRVAGDADDALHVIEALGEKRASACILLVRPEQVTLSTCAAVAAAKNCHVLVDLDAGEDESRAFGLLSAVGVLFGGYSCRAHLLAGNRARLIALASQGAASLVQVDPDHLTSDFAVDVYEVLTTLRDDLSIPILPIDLYGDILRAGRYISGEATLAFVGANGALSMRGWACPPYDAVYDTRIHPLRTIFSRVSATGRHRFDLG